VEAEIARAQRFTIPMTLRYRPTGQEGWKQGTVENISRSGVLFRAQDEVELKTAVDISLTLELPESGAVPEVLCWGEIVRAVRKEGRPELAAKILDYNFVRPGARDAFDAAVPLAIGDSN
jgi:hypothetical protein